MATITFEGYLGAGPAWSSLASGTVVFCSSLTDLATNITVDAYQDGTHFGADDPGADWCGANHMNNVKFLATGTMSVNGGGSESINDTNLTQNECTIRVHFNDAASVTSSGARFYTFDGSVVANEAVGVTVYAFEQGQSNTAWELINDDAGNIGGDNAGERLDVSDQGAGTDLYWYIAVSVSPQSVGAKTSFDLGFALTYS